MSAEPSSQDLAKTPTPYGEIINLKFEIADIRIGNADADKSGISKYTAPAGFSILGQQIKREGFHSGVTHVETVSPGRLSYESSAYVALQDSLRKGLIEGKLHVGDGNDTSQGSVFGATQFSDFQKTFHAKYQFLADTHGSISFRWWVDSKRFSHGAKLIASAEIQLRKLASEADAERAAELIKFVIETGESHSVFDLMDKVLRDSTP